GRALNRRVEIVGLTADWEPLTDEFPSLSIGAIAIHSHDADGLPLTDNYMGTGQPTPVDKLVVYAGTGEFSSQAEGGLAIGVLKSSNGGRTWQLKTSSELAGQAATAIEARRRGSGDVLRGGRLPATPLDRP